MKAKALIAGCVMVLVGMFGAEAAQAAPSSTGDLDLVAQGATYKEAQRPVNLTLDVNIIPETGALTLKPLVNVLLKFPAGLDLVADPKKTKVCSTSEFGPENANVPPDVVKGRCPNSILGDGTTDLFLAQSTSAPVHDAKLTIFNGGKDANGNTVTTIHGYSASLNQGIYMSGAIKNGTLSVDIPRLTADTSVSHFQLRIPGDIGQDPGYARAACPTGHWDATSTITLANRDEAGTESNREVLNPPAESNKPCTGLAGKAQLAGLKVKGPKKVKNGKKGAFKLTLKNTGTATAKNIKVKASGAGKGTKSAGSIAPGASKTVTVKAKVKGKKGKKVTVKFKASGGASASGKAKVKIG